MLAAENVVVRYGEVSVLRGINFRLRAGEIVGLVAPNGAGKTTLLRTAVGLQPPSSGAIFLGGTHLNKVPRQIRYRQLFFADAGHCLWPSLTVREHFDHVRRIWHSKESVTAVIDRLGVGWFSNRRVGALSLGMKQMTVIGMALTSGASILLMDEPMNGLDPTNASEVCSMLQELCNNGVTLMLSSHILSSLDALSDRVLFLKDGLIVREHAPRDATNTSAQIYLDLYQMSQEVSG